MPASSSLAKSERCACCSSGAAVWSAIAEMLVASSGSERADQHDGWRVVLHAGGEPQGRGAFAGVCLRTREGGFMVALVGAMRLRSRGVPGGLGEEVMMVTVPRRGARRRTGGGLGPPAVTVIVEADANVGWPQASRRTSARRSPTDRLPSLLTTIPATLDEVFDKAGVLRARRAGQQRAVSGCKWLACQGSGQTEIRCATSPPRTLIAGQRCRDRRCRAGWGGWTP